MKSLNRRPAYVSKSDQSDHYLSFTIKDHPPRWILSDKLFETKGIDYISHKGKEFCPDFVGNKWVSHRSNNTPDPKIKVECAGIKRVKTKF